MLTHPRRYLRDRWIRRFLEDMALLGLTGEESFTVFTVEGTILEVAGAVENLYGRPASEVAGSNILDYYPAEKRDQLRSKLRELTSVGFLALSLERVHPDGRRIPVRIRSRYFPRWRVIVSMVRDVTRQHRAHFESELVGQIMRASSRIDHLPADAESEARILERVCRILVEDVALERVWVERRGESGEPAIAAFPPDAPIDPAGGPEHRVLAVEPYGASPLSLCMAGLLSDRFSPAVEAALDRLAQEVGYALYTFRDRRVRLENEARLSLAVERLSSAEQVGQSGSWSWDVATGKIHWSEGMYRLVGIDPSEPTPSLEEYLECVHPSDRAAVAASIAELAEGAGEPLPEYRILRRDGEIRTLEPRLARRVDDEGNVVEYSGLAIDITDRKTVEEQLEVLRRAIEHTPVSVVITNAAGEIEYVNPAFSRISGYTREEVLGANPRILKSGNTPLSVYRDLWETISQGREWRGRLQNRRKDGTHFWEDVSIAPTAGPDDASRRYIAVKMDITEQIRLSNDIRDIRHQLHQSQKAEVLGSFAAGIAHDFNNLLTVIGGYASLLARDLSGDTCRLTKVQEIEKTSQRGAELARKLLSFGRRQPVNIQSLDLGDFLESSRKMLGRLVGDRHQVTLSPPPEGAVIGMDPGQLDQIVMNLVANARDAMPEGGEIRLGVAFRDGQDGSDTDPAVELTVRDSGIGMDEDLQARIFDPFFTTKDADRGTGLGLSIVRDIVSQCGGVVDVESRPGEGTTFRVLFPRASRIGSMRRATPAALVAGEGETILVVDDQEAIVVMLRILLEDSGYRVLTANSAAKALEILRDARVPVDLLLTDVMMPGTGGRELVFRARRDRPGLRALLMTGHELPQGTTPEEGPLEDPVLTKPFTPRDLLGRIQDLLRERRAA